MKHLITSKLAKGKSVGIVKMITELWRSSLKVLDNSDAGLIKTTLGLFQLFVFCIKREVKKYCQAMNTLDFLALKTTGH